jgi:carboxymethylenebutenolidase
VIPQVEIIVCYGSHSHDAAASLPEHTPVVAHLPGASKETVAYAINASSSTRAFHQYPQASTHFAIPAHEHYSASAANLAHSRSLLAIKRALGGPYFDLEAIWDEHTALEFGERSVEKTMGTMVAEPYVNHVPTLTGGVGREALTAFYRDHFIFGNPADTRLELVSRTTGHDKVVDEFLFCCTHDRMLDWL